MIHLADTHCHLDFATFNEDRSEVLERAWNAGLNRILNPGIDVETSRNAIKLAENNEKIFAAIGVHPSEVKSVDVDTTSDLYKLLKNPKVVAVGEIGLDYYHNRATSEAQKIIFKAQLKIAAESNKPVIVHSRQAVPETLTILSEWFEGLVRDNHPLADHPGVLHSFEGTIEETNQAKDINFLIGISGPVTFKNAVDKHNLASRISLDQLLIETDAPYLTPHPFRGRRNEPSFVRWVADRIAVLQNQPITTVAEVTSQNAARLFAWSL